MKTELKEETKRVSEMSPIKLGIDDVMYVFYFRRPFAAENTEAYLKFTAVADLTGMDKGEKSYEIIKSNLIEFSSKAPEKHLEVDGKFVLQNLPNTSVTHAFDVFFAEYTPENEQILTDAWLEFQKKLQSRLYS
jgi:hypothetical protein